MENLLKNYEDYIVNYMYDKQLESYVVEVKEAISIPGFITLLYGSKEALNYYKARVNNQSYTSIEEAIELGNRFDDLKMLPMRKIKKLFTYKQCLDVIEKQNYGVMSYMLEYPCALPINYILEGNTLYFHTGLIGQKHEAINQMVCFNIIEDLGINQIAATQNHCSVNIYGILEEVQTGKKEIMTKFLNKLAPNNKSYDLEHYDFNKVCVLKLDISYMIGRRHFH